MTLKEETMIEEIAQVVQARVLWALIPSRAALGFTNARLAEIASWAADNVTADVRSIVSRHSDVSRGDK